MALEQEPDPLRRIPVKHTADLKAEIGAVLRAARLKRGQSLEAVAQQTRISKRFLEALEGDKFEQFPAVVYLRGFLKGYCEHLDVDFDSLWAKFEASQAPAAPEGSPSGAAAASPSAAPAPKAFTPAGRASLHSHPTPAPKPAHDDSHSAPAHAAAHAHPAPKAPAGVDAPHGDGASGATPALVLAAVLGIALVVWIWRDQAKTAQPPATASPVALQPLPRAVEPKLVIKLQSDAWLRVVVDGQMVFEGRAPRGAAQEWKPGKTIGIRTTEPSALVLELNGAPLALGNPSADGEYRVEIP